MKRPNAALAFMNPVVQSFLKVNKRVTKWESYFDVYNQFLNKYVGTQVNLIEIGVCDGGSLEMWKAYLGSSSTIIGIDVDVNSASIFQASEHSIIVEIGDQADHAFLSSVIDKHGIPNIVVDDGSHCRKDIWSTIQFFLPKMQPGSVYIVEDLHGSFWDPSDPQSIEDNTFADFLKIVRSLNAPGSRGVLEAHKDWSSVYSVSFYWSMAVMEIKASPTRYMCVSQDGSGIVKLVTSIPSLIE